MIEFTDKQDEAYCLMYNSLVAEEPAFVLGGVAGSGKTTIIERVLKDMHGMFKNVACVSTTGRAAYNLAKRGLPNCSTIASLFYEAEYDSEGVFLRFVPRHPQEIKNEFSAIVVEEASMVTAEYFERIADVQLPLVFVGDPVQLESICPQKFNIMEEMDFCLDEIHRVAEDNPVIAFSGHVRKHGTLPRSYACDTIQFKNKNRLDVGYFKEHDHSIVLCGRNDTRQRLNRVIRFSNGVDDERAVEGETVVCVRNGTDSMGNRLYNGTLYQVQAVSHYGEYSMYSLLNRDTEATHYVKVHEDSWYSDHPNERDTQLGQYTHLEFGYAMTVHKSQGSQFSDVLYVDEDVSWFLDQKRFRYTGITRTTEKLSIAV